MPSQQFLSLYKCKNNFLNFQIILKLFLNFYFTTPRYLMYTFVYSHGVTIHINSLASLNESNSIGSSFWSSPRHVKSTHLSKKKRYVFRSIILYLLSTFLIFSSSRSIILF